ncbi:MAG: hypothetical protein IKZ26_00770 [Peptococcaceae bacterium]|nr:hypothetical protein [Peptococcaceae bacterium]
MLTKLLKYEMKASARTLIPLYIATLAVAVVCGVQMRFLMNPLDFSGSQVTFSGMLFLVLFGLCVAIGVLTLMTIVQRFNISLIGDEGYLMFTLPVTHTQLLSSKLIGAILWSVIGTIVMVLAAGIIFIFSMVSMPSGVYFADVPSMLPLSIVYGFIQMTATILLIYFSIMIAQTERFSHHRVAVGVVLFFVLNWLFDGVAGFLFMTEAIPDIALLSDQFMQAYYWQMVCVILYKLVQCVVLFIGTKWLMQNKLNL